MTGKKVSNFSERIAQLIESTGKTQTAVARDFGVSKQTISAWITGQNSPRIPIVYALSYYFNVSIEWLMGFDVPQYGHKDALTQKERQVIAAYRAADDRAQEDALRTLLDHPAVQKKENLA